MAQRYKKQKITIASNEIFVKISRQSQFLIKKLKVSCVYVFYMLHLCLFLNDTQLKFEQGEKDIFSRIFHAFIYWTICPSQ